MTTDQAAERAGEGMVLGPFVLERPIGSGGMGEVWRAVHGASGVPVAIKVIASAWARQPSYARAFEREVRAIAGLSHPGIVAVHDQGIVGASAARASGGALAAESPYLVMEYMPRGSLEAWSLAQGWPFVQVVAQATLEALAHAHARGVVHCDLKPANVMLAGAEEVAIKLTDFGVAHALAPLEEAEDGPRSAGTPAYMAPEQLLGQWREFGPWTDLYALGCTLWELCCGTPPFAAGDLAGLAGMHLHAPPGRFAPLQAVPAGVEGWLRRLLAKRPRDRFACAADAAWALRQVSGACDGLRWAEVVAPRGEVDRAAATQALPAAPEQKAWSAASTVIAAPVDWTARTRLADDTDGGRVSLSEGAGAPGHGLQDMPEQPADTPPLVSTWRRAEAPWTGPLQGAGLGLVRFREVPLVGREAERDGLWAALAAVHAGAGPRVVIVRGPSGVGKSRVVEWIAARAHEVGAATVLRAAHGPFGGPGEGLPRMLALHLQCVGLDADETYARVLQVLSDGGAPGEALRYEAAALAEFVRPGGRAGPRVRLAEQRERHAVLAGYLTRLAARRPAMVWFDDAMWGPPALDFTRYLLGLRGGPRALIVLTVRDDRLGERPTEARMLAELAELPGVTAIEVAPLAEEEHRALIGERLGLDGRVVEDVLARAGGNPLFSLQVIGDWIARGLLVRGERGFALRDGADATLPEDMHALWCERLARLLGERYAGEDARLALELAAALGLEIDPRAWSRACALAGVTPPPGLVELLIGEHLAVATRAGWAFVHGMLRESLEHMAEEAGRKAGHHRVCAEILRDLYGEHAQGHAEEVARHLIVAGDLGDAMGALLDATYQMQLSGQYERAERVLGEHAALADRLGLAQDDVRRLRGRMQTVWLLWMRGGEGKLERSRAGCREIEKAARRGGHDDVLGESLRWHGMVARFERRWDESVAALEQAAACFERVGDPEGQARTALAQAVTLRALGRLDEAEAALAAAERRATTSELFVLLPRIFGNLAEIALQRGDWAAAELRFGRAIAAAEDSGDRKAQALTFGGAGDLALARGRFAEADAHYRRAEALLTSLGSRYVHGVRVRRSSVELLRGASTPAAPLRDCVARTDRDPLARAEAHLGLALAAAREQAWADVDAQVTAGERLLTGIGETRPVIVQLLEAVAAAVTGAGEAAQGDRLRVLASTQAGRLDASA